MKPILLMIAACSVGCVGAFSGATVGSDSAAVRTPKAEPLSLTAMIWVGTESAEIVPAGNVRCYKSRRLDPDERKCWRVDPKDPSFYVESVQKMRCKDYQDAAGPFADAGYCRDVASKGKRQ